MEHIPRAERTVQLQSTWHLCQCALNRCYRVYCVCVWPSISKVWSDRLPYIQQHAYCEAEEVGPNVTEIAGKNSLNNSHDVCEVHKSWENTGHLKAWSFQMHYVSCSWWDSEVTKRWSQGLWNLIAEIQWNEAPWLQSGTQLFAIVWLPFDGLWRWRDFNLFWQTDNRLTDWRTDKTDCLTPLRACARRVMMIIAWSPNRGNTFAPMGTKNKRSHTAKMK